MTQGNLCPEYSVVWLLERADLPRSDPLALEYLLAVTDYGVALSRHLYGVLLRCATVA